MSRIQFEWEVEAEKRRASYSEDPLFRRARRQKLQRMLLLSILLLIALALAGIALHFRLVQTQAEIARQLQDSIRAEVAALRIGDRRAFLDMQAGDAVWLKAQAAYFAQVEAWKADGAIGLSGDILALQIDGKRARALLREDHSGLPYARLWFYRLGGDGWRHTAPDFDFWGEAQTYRNGSVTVDYRETDELFARQLGDALSAWISAGCGDNACDSSATLSALVSPDLDVRAGWGAGSGMLLARSPYVELARADTPLDESRLEAILRLLEENWLPSLEK